MIEKILNNYSVGELSEIIGSEYISLYEKIKGEEVSKSELLSAVQVISGYEFVTSEEHRNTFIDRMSLDDVDHAVKLILERLGAETLFDEIGDKYSFLQRIGHEYPVHFSHVLGFGELYEEAMRSDSDVEGIRKCEPNYSIYPYQGKIVETVMELMINAEDRRCLIHLPTGAGKTRTAMNIACEHLRKDKSGLVLWLADTSELCGQAADEFYKAWSSLGNRDMRIYSFYSNSDISLGGVDEGFLVAGLQKINSLRSGEREILYRKLREKVSLVIFDEAHKAIAPTYAQTVNDMLGEDELDDTFLIGLTATPGRKLNAEGDIADEDMELTRFFGSKKVTMKVAGYQSPIKYLVEKRYLAKAEFHTINYDGVKIIAAEKFKGNKLTSEVAEQLTSDKDRNNELIKTVKTEYNQGSSIIIFACSIEHSRSLSTLLAFEGIKSYSLDSKYDTHESRRLKVSEYSSGAVKVLINYNILTAGFDAPITNVAIVARPTDSLVQYSQMIGRAMRGFLSGGNDKCRIYTVRDDIPAFRSVQEAFSHWDEMWKEV
jgi:DNA repair protein RadD